MSSPDDNELLAALKALLDTHGTAVRAVRLTGSDSAESGADPEAAVKSIDTGPCQCAACTKALALIARTEGDQLIVTTGKLGDPAGQVSDPDKGFSLRPVD